MGDAGPGGNNGNVSQSRSTMSSRTGSIALEPKFVHL
jgi:hypothetical protein